MALLPFHSESKTSNKPYGYQNYSTIIEAFNRRERRKMVLIKNIYSIRVRTRYEFRLRTSDYDGHGHYIILLCNVLLRLRVER